MFQRYLWGGGESQRVAARPDALRHKSENFDNGPMLD
jgi:hypothetical protein